MSYRSGNRVNYSYEAQGYISGNTATGAAWNTSGRSRSQGRPFPRGAVRKQPLLHGLHRPTGHAPAITVNLRFSGQYADEESNLFEWILVLSAGCWLQPERVCGRESTEQHRPTRA